MEVIPCFWMTTICIKTQTEGHFSTRFEMQMKLKLKCWGQKLIPLFSSCPRRTFTHFLIGVPCLCRPGFRRQRLWNTRGWSRVRPWLDHRETTASCWKPVMAPPFFLYTLVLCQRCHQTVQECVWNGRNTLASATLHHLSHHFEVLPSAPTSPSFLTHFRRQTREARLVSTRLAALL